MISIIIPTLNEERALPKTLANVLTQPVSKEIIVVDGGSDDRTRDIVFDTDDVSLIRSNPGRATQMNAGAKVATGEWLLFLHADTLLPENALQRITELSTSKIQAGCFHQRFSGEHWFLQFVSWLHNVRCKKSRVMYGDQAMFVRRDFFQNIGGFPDEKILEDVAISHRIKRQTQAVFLEEAVITSSRKFEQRGVFKSFFDIVIIMACYEFRLPIKRQGFFAAFR